MNSIKRLEIMGFKSFYNRQEIVLPPHMNVVMGPNGSGKSNVIESLTFVLGKSSRKELRAEKMGDLVYNGGKKLPPGKFSKVTAILDNKNRRMPIDEDEIKISRKVDKEGRSIYKVNGKRQPREYIKNLLGHAGIDPDGYNFVMQGEIEKFIALSSEERRKIIEDLSGISIYENKKHKCLLELDKVQKKINDARIILNEKVKHMEELKKEKEQAEKFSNLQEKLDYKKASKVTLEIKKMEKERDGVQKQYDEKNKIIEKDVLKKEKITEKINLDNISLDNLNKELERQGETEQVQLNKEIEHLRIRSNELKTLIKSEENEINRIAERIEQLKKDKKVNEEKLQNVESNIGGKGSELGQRKDALKLQEEKFEKLNNIDKERVTLMTSINDVEKEILEIKGKMATMEKLRDMGQERDKLEHQLTHLKADLTAKLDENSTVAGELSELQDKKSDITKELHLLEGKREALLRMLDRGVQNLIQAKDSKRIKGIQGIISELGKTDKEYALPLKVAAGGRANAVVVDDVDIAKECLEYLRENKYGIATLLPMDKITGNTSDQKIDDDGFIGYAIDLVKFKPKYKNIFEYVFSDTIIVRDIESARRIGVNKYRMVTLRGDLFDKSGAIHGGFRKKEGLGFKEDSIEEKLAEYKSSLGEIEGNISKYEPQEEKTSDEISLLRGRVYEIEEKLKSFQELDLSKIDELKEQIKEKEAQQKKIWESMKDLPKTVSPEYLNKLNEKIRKERDAVTALEGERKGFDVETQIIKRDIERAEQLIKGLEKENTQFEKRIEENKKDIEKTDNKLTKKLDEEKKFHGKLKELYAKRNKMMEDIKTQEIERNKMENQIEIIRRDAQEFQLGLAEIKAKLEGRYTALEEFKGIEITQIKENMEKLEEQIKNLEEIVSNYGPVNMRALDVYHEVEKEHNTLKERTEKLFNEKEEVLQVMNEVEGQKKETFMETFNAIAENFSNVFGTISIKGEGKLILENPENPFDGGIDIEARPGGKKMISLRSMSGGEKTLTTLAFIFAVQEFQPSPFYIMDEVDAALDKENSERLGILISEYSKTSQFIIISHNDSIISQGDNIFGVHMNELGESRVVSIKLPAK